MYGYIYKRVNTINGMTYVGQHKYERDSVELDESYRGSGKYFKRAVEQYGEDSFSYELIDTAESPEELNEKEIFWISELNTRVPNGYNITAGGDGIIVSHEQRVEWGSLGSSSGWKQSQHQKDVVRDYMTNRVITDEFREKCRQAKLGNTNAAGNKDMIWITDGENNYKIHPGDEYDETRFQLGKRTLSEATITKLSEDYKNRTYVTKDGIDKNIKNSELQQYLDMGYVIGKDPKSYVNRGEAIRNAKKGAIRMVNSDGVIKYVKPEREQEMNELGFYRYSNK